MASSRAGDEGDEEKKEGARAQARVVVTDDEKCRICFAGAEDGPLVQPCACRGASSWVHAR